MKIYNIVTAVCLGLMVVGTLSVIINLFLKERSDKITYIRSFKKGKGALIYIFAIPLLWIGLFYAEHDLVSTFFGAIRRGVELIVLRYDILPIQDLVKANGFYAFTIYLCYTLICLNAILFAVSLISQHLWNYFRNLLFKYTKKEKVILFGNNVHNHTIYFSEARRKAIIIDKIMDKDALGLYMKNITYTSVGCFDKYIESTVSSCIKKSNVIYTIINMGDDEKNIELCRSFIKYISSLKEEQQIRCFNQLKIFVFGDPRYEAIYEDIISDGVGCISYINKYQKIAVDFIDKYPISLFMNESHIDYETSLIKEGVDIHTVFIGFGKTNQQIFLTSVANNQFITKVEDTVEVKKVKYYIFDKNFAENNKNLNHNYNRYKNECVGVNQGDYLPLPSYPAEERFYRLDINDMNFYNEIRKIVCDADKAVNFIVIAFGSDLENIDMAQKLVLKCKEWGAKNISIFVKVRGEHKGQILLEKKNCYVIGNENEVVYNIENIIGDPIFRMAQMRNTAYHLEDELTQGNFELTEERALAIKRKAYKNWFVKKSQLERESSIYCCLSLRSKLNLMGLDYCNVSSDKPALSEVEYLTIYAQGDLPDVNHYKVKVDGKPIVHYTMDFPDSRRRNLAIHEHLRWNSFMISKGMVPATKKQILEEIDAEGKYTNGKNYAVRRHGNITTFEGLVAFRKMLAVRDKASNETLLDAEARKDVIKYDYQLMDDAFWLLTNSGYKIVKK